jgi:hypothetical protein
MCLDSLQGCPSSKKANLRDKSLISHRKVRSREGRNEVSLTCVTYQNLTLEPQSMSEGRTKVPPWFSVRFKDLQLC